jgi:hypothetical protein
LGGAGGLGSVVGVGLSQQLAVAAHDVPRRWRPERRLAHALESHHAERPGRGVLERRPGERRAPPGAGHGGDEVGADRPGPGDGPADGGHHRRPQVQVEPPGGVHGTEHLLLGGVAVVEVEGQALAVAAQLVAHRVEPDGVGLEAVAQPWLGDAPPVLELAGEA